MHSRIWRSAVVTMVLVASVVASWSAVPVAGAAVVPTGGDAARGASVGIPRKAVMAPLENGAGATVPGTYTTLAPTRLLDTRTGLGAQQGPVESWTRIAVRVLGRGGVPATGVGSVVVSLTATQPAGAGSVRVWPDGDSMPNTSNLNYLPGTTVANTAVVPVGVDGDIAVLNAGSPVQLIADVTGYYTSGASTVPGAFVALPAQRLLDTRSGVGAPAHPAAANTALSVKVAGRGGIPAGATSVAVNLTVVNPHAAGYLTAWASGSARPNTSTINFAVGQTVANLAYLPISSDGAIQLFNSSRGAVDLLADIAGYIIPGVPDQPGTYVAVNPVRLLDTRNVNAVPGAPIAAGGLLTAQLGGSGVPRDGVAAVVLNMTVTAPTQPGYVTAWAAGAGRPGTSNANFAAGQTVATFATVSIGSADSIDAFNGSAGSLQLIADVTGYYLSAHISHVNMRWSAPSAPVPVLLGFISSSCVSVAFCEALTYDGRVFTYDGQRWSYQSDLPGSQFEAISCASIDFCAAVNGMGTAFIYSAARWSAPVTIPGHQEMFSVSCVSTTFCMAVSHESDYAVIYNGTSWAESPYYMSGETPHVFTVTCASAASCFAGNGSASIFHYRGVGSGWSENVVAGASTQIVDLSCSRTGLCAATDMQGRAFTFNGTSWSAPVSLDPAVSTTPDPELPVSCQASSCLAVDDLGRSFTYNGTTWAHVPSADIAAYSSISCVDATFCLLASISGDIMTFNGSAWSPPTMVTPATALSAVSCISAIACTAVGKGGQVQRFDGALWSAPTVVDPYGNLRSVSCTTDGFCAAVDNIGNVVTDTGTGWTAPERIDNPVTGDKNISCASATFCAMSDQAGQVAVMRGTAWGPLTPVLPGHQLRSISCPAATFCAAVAADGYASTFDGQGWTPAARALAGSLVAVSCPIAGWCMATSNGDVMSNDYSAVIFSGGGWHSLAPNPNPLQAISCVSVMFCAAADNSSLPVTFNGAAWSEPDVSTFGPAVDSISCPSTTFCAALTDNSTVSIGRS